MPDEARPSVAVALLAWLFASPGVAEHLGRRLGLVRANFLGDAIPCSNGLAVLSFAVPALALQVAVAGIRAQALAMLSVVLAFGLLGLADDLWGDRTASGFRGHLLALARRRRLTTGLLKAVLGAAAGIFVARLFSSDSWSLAFAEGVAIALCANAVNLLDVRPGRAGACFLAGGYAMTLVHLARGDAAGLLPLMAVWLPAALVQRGDAQAKAMLGDAGSNLLGAALGLELVLAAQSPGSLAALVALLAALHLVSERASLTSLIERSRLLRRLDSLTGLRGRPP